MRAILHVIDTGGPGGAETVFANLASKLFTSEFQHIAVIERSDWLHLKLQSLSVNTKVIASAGRFNISYLLKLIFLVRQSNASVIISHLLGSNLYCSLVSLFTRVPVICVFHGPSDISGGSAILRFKIFLINRLATHIVFISDSLRNELQERVGFRHKGVSVIHNGVETVAKRKTTSNSLKTQLGLDLSTVLVGSIGNVRLAKNYKLLARAARYLSDKTRDFHFVIYGDNSSKLFAELLDYCSEIGVSERMHWMGFCEDVPSALAAFDIYAISSDSEGLSLSCLEAMMVGVPIVSTECGGLTEVLVNNHNGLLVPLDDEKSLANAIFVLASDKEMQERLTLSAARVVREEFGIDSMSLRYEALVRTLC